LKEKKTVSVNAEIESAIRTPDDTTNTISKPDLMDSCQ
jgi:hypothetical protein